MKNHSIYVASLEQYAGSLIVTMGMMELLKRQFSKVAFFRPIIDGGEEQDPDIHCILGHFHLKTDYEESWAFTLGQAERMVAENRLHDLMEGIIRKFKALEEKYEFILIEGMSRARFHSSMDYDINLEIAKNLGVPFVSIINGKGKSAAQVMEEVRIESGVIRQEGCAHLATFANRLSKTVKEDLEPEAGGTPPLYLLPEVAELDTPTMAEVKETLGGRLVFGDEKDLNRTVRRTRIAAMTVDNFLPRFEDGDLIIVPGDRSDVIIACFAAIHSRNFPNVSGLLLTGGLLPSPAVTSLLEGLGNTFPLPVLAVETDTYTTAAAVHQVPAQITPERRRKIALAMGLFSANVDPEELERHFSSVSSTVMTPLMFEYNLFERARRDKKRIVLPESGDERILRAAEILLHRQVVEVVLLGNREEIEHRCSVLRLDLAGAEIIDPCTSPMMDEFTNEFYEMRKAKGLTPDAARDAMEHVSYFATMMVHKGLADGMVSGATHTTADTIRPALQIIKTKPGISIVSSVFFMCLDTQVLVYGDCAVNQDPDAAQLAQIAVSSAETAEKFGIEPKVAMLSYSTGSSGQGADVEKVREATALVREMRPELAVEGPIQYDAAVEPAVASQKLPESKVAGQATIFVFPDLNTGNNTYKAVQRSAGAVAIGPVLQGLKKPINDLSRGCLVEDVVNTVAITAIQAQGGDQ